MFIKIVKGIIKDWTILKKDSETLIILRVMECL